MLFKTGGRPNMAKWSDCTAPLAAFHQLSHTHHCTGVLLFNKSMSCFHSLQFNHGQKHRRELAPFLAVDLIQEKDVNKRRTAKCRF